MGGGDTAQWTSGPGASMCSPEESSLSYSPCLCLFLGRGGTLLGVRARLGFAAGTGCGQGGGGLGPAMAEGSGGALLQLADNTVEGHSGQEVRGIRGPGTGPLSSGILGGRRLLAALELR